MLTIKALIANIRSSLRYMQRAIRELQFDQLPVGQVFRKHIYAILA